MHPVSTGSRTVVLNANLKPINAERMIQAQTRCRHRLAKHIAARRGRTIYRDVAYRYLQRFGGQVFTVRTAIDDADNFLENASGRILGSVSYSDKYPKLPAAETFDGMPF